MQVSEDNKSLPILNQAQLGEKKPESKKQNETSHISSPPQETDKIHIQVNRDTRLPSLSVINRESYGNHRTVAEEAQDFHEQNKYQPRQSGARTRIQVSENVSIITDIGEVEGDPIAKVGAKYQGDRFSAYAVVDATSGDVDAGAKYKLGENKKHYILAETNKMYTTDAHFHRLAVGGRLVEGETGNLDYKAFAGYIQGVELRSRYSEGGEHDMGIAGVEVSGKKTFKVHQRVDIELDGRSRVTGGVGLKFPEGTKENLDFSQNGEVPTIPGTDIPIDNGISSALFTNRNDARVAVKVVATDALTVRPYMDGEVVAGSSYIPLYEVAGGVNAEYQVSDKVALEGGVRAPIVSSKLYQPITVSSGVKVGQLRLGAYMGIQDGKTQSGGGQISYDHKGNWSISGNVGSDRGYASASVGFRFNFDGPGKSNIDVETYHINGLEKYKAQPIIQTSPSVPGGLANASWEETVKALDTPDKVAGYDRGYIDYIPHGNGTYTPKETYENKSGVCRDHARFQASVLKTHGYQAYMLSYGGAAVNHAFVAYIDKDGTWNAIEYGRHYQAKANSFEELVASLQQHFSDKKGYDIDWTRVGLVEADSLTNMYVDQAAFVHEAINRGFDGDLKY